MRVRVEPIWSEERRSYISQFWLLNDKLEPKESKPITIMPLRQVLNKNEAWAEAAFKACELKLQPVWTVNHPYPFK